MKVGDTLTSKTEKGVVNTYRILSIDNKKQEVRYAIFAQTLHADGSSSPTYEVNVSPLSEIGKTLSLDE